MADTKVIEIIDGTARFKYVRRGDDPFRWDMHVWHELSDGSGCWGEALDLPTDGRDVLWQCAGMTSPRAPVQGQAP